MLEDILYQLSTKDLSGSLITPFSLSASLTLAAPGSTASVTLDTTGFPLDRLILLETATIQGTPTAITECQSVLLNFFPTPALGVVLMAETFPAVSVAITKAFGRPIRKLLPPRAALTATARFDGNALHTVSCTLSGILIPKGNISGV